jgi:hypothetical protein
MSENQNTETRKSAKLIAGILSAPKKAAKAVAAAPKAVVQEMRYFADDVKKEMADNQAAGELTKTKEPAKK